ncbi:hypothetical protein KY342_05280 [Candidatus Woesearchaeota archaeon]|nr:hypothetical protein [Candidatus Woesearchaeota archaeon]
MVKKIKLGLMVCILLFSIATVEALIVPRIDIKSEFRTGEIISFNFTIYSDINQQIRYILGINCPGIPSALLELKTKDLIAEKPFSENYTGPLVDIFEPQECVAYFSLIEPYETKVDKEFRIITNPSFSFELKTCKDQACSEKSKIFIKNENIYFNYDSEVPEPTITATLTLPDKTTQQLTLPTSIKAEQIGTYELEITASKQDYKTITKKQQFAVIEKQAEIPFVGVCNANNKCEPGENYQNCPQDCRLEEIPKIPIQIILLLIIFIFILIIFCFKITKKTIKKSKR